MSNGVFQNVITQLKDATDRVIGIIDAEGSVVACRSEEHTSELQSRI